MTILSPNGQKTVYNAETKTLSRVVDNSIKTIDITNMKDMKVKDLARMTNLDDEAFSLMAYIQEQKAK